MAVLSKKTFAFVLFIISLIACIGYAVLFIICFGEGIFAGGCRSADEVFRPRGNTWCFGAKNTLDCLNGCGCAWCNKTNSVCLPLDQQFLCDGLWTFYRTEECLDKYNSMLDICKLEKNLVIYSAGPLVFLVIVSCLVHLKKSR